MNGGTGIHKSSKRIKKIKFWRDASLILPTLGTLYDKLDSTLPVYQRDFFKNPNLRRLKIIGNFTYSLLLGGYLLLGALTGNWTPNQYIQSYKKGLSEERERLEKSQLKREVIDIVDNDDNGLSNAEEHFIDQLMGIEDSSTTYVPTREDWEKAYKGLERRLPPSSNH